MSKFIISVPDLVVSLFVVGAFLLVGIFAGKLIVKKIKKVALRLEWLNEEVLLNSIVRVVICASLMIGVYWVLNNYCGDTISANTVVKMYVSFTIVISTIICTKLSVILTDVYNRKKGNTFFSSSIFLYIIRVAVIVIGVLTCFSYWGITIVPLLTAFGIGGLAVALALRDTLSNLFAGLNILASNKLKIGDYVKVEGKSEGKIEDISWRSTTIRTAGNSITIIPNAHLASSVVTNYQQEKKEMSVPITFGVSYDSDLEVVEIITLEVARESLQAIEGESCNFEPRFNYYAFGDSIINIRVVLMASEHHDRIALRHNFIKLLQKRYKQKGIEIYSRNRDSDTKEQKQLE